MQSTTGLDDLIETLRGFDQRDTADQIRITLNQNIKLIAETFILKFRRTKNRKAIKQQVVNAIFSGSLTITDLNSQSLDLRKVEKSLYGYFDALEEPIPVILAFLDVHSPLSKVMEVDDIFSDIEEDVSDIFGDTTSTTQDLVTGRLSDIPQEVPKPSVSEEKKPPRRKPRESKAKQEPRVSRLRTKRDRDRKEITAILPDFSKLASIQDKLLYSASIPVYLAYVGVTLDLSDDYIRNTVKAIFEEGVASGNFTEEYRTVTTLKNEIQKIEIKLNNPEFNKKKNIQVARTLQRSLLTKVGQLKLIELSMNKTPKAILSGLMFVADIIISGKSPTLMPRFSDGELRSVGRTFVSKAFIRKSVDAFLSEMIGISNTVEERAVCIRVQHWFAKTGSKLLNPIIEEVNKHRRKLLRVMQKCLKSKTNSLSTQSKLAAKFSVEFVRAVVFNPSKLKSMTTVRSFDYTGTDPMRTLIRLAAHLRRTTTQLAAGGRGMERHFWLDCLTAVIPQGALKQYEEWRKVSRTTKEIRNTCATVINFLRGSTSSRDWLMVPHSTQTRRTRISSKEWQGELEIEDLWSLSDIVLSTFSLSWFMGFKPLPPTATSYPKEPFGTLRVPNIEGTSFIWMESLTDFCKLAIDNNAVEFIPKVINSLARRTPETFDHLGVSLDLYMSHFPVDIMVHSLREGSLIVREGEEIPLARFIFDLLVAERRRIILKRTRGAHSKSGEEQSMIHLISLVYRRIFYSRDLDISQELFRIFPEYSDTFNEISLLMDKTTKLNQTSGLVRKSGRGSVHSADFPPTIIEAIDEKDGEKVSRAITESLEYFNANLVIAQELYDYAFAVNGEMTTVVGSILGITRPSTRVIKNAMSFELLDSHNIGQLGVLASLYDMALLDLGVVKEFVRRINSRNISFHHFKEFLQLLSDFSVVPRSSLSIELIVESVVNEASALGSERILVEVKKFSEADDGKLVSLDKDVISLFSLKTSNLSLLASMSDYNDILVKLENKSDEKITKGVEPAILYALLTSKDVTPLLKLCFEWEYSEYAIFRALGKMCALDSSNYATLDFFVEQKEHLEDVLERMTLSSKGTKIGSSAAGRVKTLDLLVRERVSKALNGLNAGLIACLRTYVFVLIKDTSKKITISSLTGVERLFDDIFSVPLTILEWVNSFRGGREFIQGKIDAFVSKSSKPKMVQVHGRVIMERLKHRECFVAIKNFTSHHMKLKNPHLFFSEEEYKEKRAKMISKIPEIQERIIEACSDVEIHNMKNVWAIIRIFMLTPETRDPKFLLEYFKRAKSLGETFPITGKDDEVTRLPVSKGLIANINIEKYDLQGVYDLLALYTQVRVIEPNARTTMIIIGGMFTEYNRGSLPFLERMKLMIQLGYENGSFDVSLVEEEDKNGGEMTVNMSSMKEIYRHAGEHVISLFINSAISSYLKQKDGEGKEKTKALLREAFVGLVKSLAKNNIYINTKISRPSKVQKVPLLGESSDAKIETRGYVVGTEDGPDVIVGRSGQRVPARKGVEYVVEGSAFHVVLSASINMLRAFMNIGFILEDDGKPVALDLLASQRKALDVILTMYPSLQGYPIEVKRELLNLCLEHGNSELLKHLLEGDPTLMTDIVLGALTKRSTTSGLLFSLIMDTTSEDFKLLRSIMTRRAAIEAKRFIKNEDNTSVTNMLRHVTAYPEVLYRVIRSIKALTYVPAKGEGYGTNTKGASNLSSKGLSLLSKYREAYFQFKKEKPEDDGYYASQAYNTMMLQERQSYYINHFMRTVVKIEATNAAAAFINIMSKRNALETLIGLSQMSKVGYYYKSEVGYEQVDVSVTYDLTDTDLERLTRIISEEPYMLGMLTELEEDLSEDEKIGIDAAVKQLFFMCVNSAMAEPCNQYIDVVNDNGGLTREKAASGKSYSFLPSLLSSGLVPLELIEEQLADIDNIQERYADIEAIETELIIDQIRGLMNQARLLPPLIREGLRIRIGKSDPNRISDEDRLKRRKLRFIRDGLNKMMGSALVSDVMSLIELSENKTNESAAGELEKNIRKMLSRGAVFYDPDYFCVRKDLNDFLTVNDNVQRAKADLLQQRGDIENFNMNSAVETAILAEETSITMNEMSQYFNRFVRRELMTFQHSTSGVQ